MFPRFSWRFLKGVLQVGIVGHETVAGFFGDVFGSPWLNNNCGCPEMSRIDLWVSQPASTGYVQMSSGRWLTIVPHQAAHSSKIAVVTFLTMNIIYSIYIYT